MAKKKNKAVQMGNFTICEEKNATGMYLVVRNVSNTWSIRWREDSLMFMHSKGFINEGGRSLDYLHSLIAMTYAVSTYPHDLVAIIEKGETPFMNGIAKLIKEQGELEQSYKKTLSEEEDAKILEEERTARELMEAAEEEWKAEEEAEESEKKE